MLEIEVEKLIIKDNYPVPWKWKRWKQLSYTLSSSSYI